jgi:hypothetical protein
MSRNKTEGWYKGKINGVHQRNGVTWGRTCKRTYRGGVNFNTRTRAMRKYWKMLNSNSAPENQGKWGGWIKPESFPAPCKLYPDD